MGENDETILFKKFEILECLKKDVGAGVYIANHIYLGKKILLKTLDKENIAEPAMLQRFQREAKTLAQLEHPNIIKVLDFGTYEQFFYISFEYFAARNLREVFKNGRLSEAEKLHVLTQLFRGLDYAHNHRVVHRDIKPENILLNEDNLLKIADFGLAQIYGEESLTQQASIVGTPSYMSPEQIRGEELTAASDLFSAGVVAYELYCGVNPFLGKDVGATLNNILSQQVAAGETDIMPEAVRQLINGLLHKNKIERITSAAAAFKLLAAEETTATEAATESPATVSAEKKPRRRQSARARLTMVAAVVLAVVLAIWLLKPVQKGAAVPNVGETPVDSVNIVNSDSTQELAAVAAPQEKTSRPAEVANTVRETVASPIAPGRLLIECLPWADVYIDGKLVDTTPLTNPIELPAGEYEVQLKHPNFPACMQKIRIEPEKDYYLAVTLHSYLACRIYPWGEVFLNGVLLGQTPFAEPLVIAPGQHVLTVKNQDYGQIEQEFSIEPSDTFYFSLNFEQMAGQALPQ